MKSCILVYARRSAIALIEWQRECERQYREAGYFDDADRVRECADALLANETDECQLRVKLAASVLMREALSRKIDRECAHAEHT